MDDNRIFGSAFYQDYDRVNVLLQDYYNQKESPDQLSKKVLEYLSNHSDEEASATLIQFVDDENYSQALACLSESVRNGRMAVCIQAITEQRRVRRLMDDSRGKIRVGMKAPEFSSIDIEGKTLELSSYLGKYVLLDFWGSWCGPCMKGMPLLKEYYDKYKGNLEIIGIDCRDNEQTWKTTVLNNHLSWKHVQDNKDKDITTKYVVESFPTLILIDRHGVIIKIADHDKDSFFIYLDKLLNN